VIVRAGELPQDEELAADVCVIGAGAAGLAVAAELLPSSLSTLVVESGGLAHDAAGDELDEGEVVGQFNGLVAGRARGLGGTTQLWPGQCMRLDPDDLRARPWIPESGWPLDWEELAAYYPRALEALDLPADVLDRDVFGLFRVERPAFDTHRLEPRFTAFSPAPDRGRALLPRLRSAPRLRVVLGATAVSLVPDEAGRRVARVELRTTAGNRLSVEARALVLCCGGIENARLLLVSGDAARGGLANPHGTVGSRFQDHAALRAGTIATSDPRRLQTVFGVFFRRRLRYHPKLVLSRALQERDAVLACGASIAFELPERSGVAAGMRIARQARARRWPQRLPTEARLVLRDLPAVASGAARRYARGWSPAFPPSRIELLLVCEQAPNAASRLTLAESVDRFGVPRPRVEWRLTELEQRTMQLSAEIVRDELSGAGLGSVELLPELAEPAAWIANAFDTFHHTGSTRMAEDPHRGVVDSDCRVHGLANLFVAGSSVFPTSGFAHPTLTIVALAIRLADRLRKDLAR
jgi:choline dehydrogenase-like flavoprotein